MFAAHNCPEASVQARDMFGETLGLGKIFQRYEAHGHLIAAATPAAPTPAMPDLCQLVGLAHRPPWGQPPPHPSPSLSPPQAVQAPKSLAPVVSPLEEPGCLTADLCSFVPHVLITGLMTFVCHQLLVL